MVTAKGLLSTAAASPPDPLEGFPISGFVRERQILAFIPVDRSTLWRWVRLKTFPAPQKLSEKVTAWSAAEVRQHLAERGALSIAA